MEQNRYHKHTCTKNELCQRANDQSIYLDLCSIDNINNYIENNLKINLNKLKNDINYRNEYLQNKKIHNDLYLKKQRKLEIERLYKSGFEEYTFNLEEPLYRHIISNIELELGYYQREIENNPYAIDTRPTANSIWQIKSRDLKYSSSKKNWKLLLNKKEDKQFMEKLKWIKKNIKSFRIIFYKENLIIEK